MDISLQARLSRATPFPIYSVSLSLVKQPFCIRWMEMEEGFRHGAHTMRHLVSTELFIVIRVATELYFFPIN